MANEDSITALDLATRLEKSAIAVREYAALAAEKLKIADDALDSAARERAKASQTPTAAPSDAEVSDHMLIAAMNTLHGYNPPVTDITYWSAGYAENIRAGIRAALLAAQEVRRG